MKKLKILIATICCLLNLQISWGQTYKYPIDKGNCSDNDIINACLDFVKQNNIYKGEQTVSRSGTYYKFPNNRGIVVTSFDLTHKEKYDLKEDNMYWDPWTGWQKAESIRYTINSSQRHAVFVNENGFPLKAVSVSERFNIIPLDNKILLLKSYLSIDKDNNNARSYVYREIQCFDYNGNYLWISDNDMVFLDYALTNNNIYIVGEVRNPEFKVIGISNGVVQTDKRIAESGSRYTNVSLKMNGVTVKRLFKDGHTTTETFDYEADDKSYQEKLIFKSYNTNNALDQVEIGMKFLNGKDWSKDEKKAVEWFQKSANQNNDKGQYMLGYCYQKGLGVSQDKVKAASLYEKAIKQGNKDAMAALSKMYLNGDGVTKDLAKALHWQEILAFDGDKEAQKTVLSNQSVQYEKAAINAAAAKSIAISSHLQKDYQWSEYCIKRAIELGNKDARLYYGLWLAKGEGVQKDYTKAEEYLLPFAESGDKNATTALGSVYQALNDKKKEMFWVEKAAANGDVESQVKLANAYLNGIGVKKDKKKAAELYEKAAYANNEEAIKMTCYNYGQGNGVKKNVFEAVSWANRLSPQLQIMIADKFFDGDGVKKNKEIAIRIWRTLSTQHNFEALKYLALCCIYGDGMDRNLNEAERLIGQIDNISNLDYATKYSESSYLMGLLNEARGYKGQAIENYRNSSKQEAKDRLRVLQGR